VKLFLVILCLTLTGELVFAQTPQVLSPSKINRLLPTRMEGYHLQESKSDLLKIGSLRYSLSERLFMNDDKVVKILLFDYGEAQIMYHQAMSRWEKMTNVQSDTTIFRKASSPFFQGWESFTKKDNHAQLIGGINNRFFFTLSGANMGLDELNSLSSFIAFDKFPK
jgi:hypothetical protein